MKDKEFLCYGCMQRKSIKLISKATHPKKCVSCSLPQSVKNKLGIMGAYASKSLIATAGKKK